MNPLLALRAAECAREHLREHPGRWGCVAALLLLGPPAICVLIVVFLLTALTGTSDTSSAAAPAGAVADIPAEYLALYRQAAQTCPGLDWSILAAIGKVETDHGRSPLPGVHSGVNSAKAGGPMQFLQSTFDGVVARHPIPPGGAHPPSRYNPHDAIYAAAAYLCDSGARDGRDFRAAIFAYNHAEWYVKKVLDQADTYRRAARGSDCTSIRTSSKAVRTAIEFACEQLGLPYVWGGDGPANGDRGFDCSGLVKAAYGAAGIDLPRTAQTQYGAGPRVALDQLQPGDLVFFGTSSNHITHVGLVLSPGMMINAPDFGKPVRVDAIGRPVGATRPASSA
ncbi:C40 family peptidase [Amycolatopsis eburnea]|uniref:Hydrolase Nlp/P60 n=1 Tax=Amycolatopsis eburnea TaxID=2267691 RepID=A0A427SYJ1_9PSEU|nr:bifunctional lytic transglycosylase/C40 family peptidase [Amycolatopsis eburnea]RSD10290.1 hydrolase Nlp/P60 [Amycolatopsis eburnea]